MAESQMGETILELAKLEVLKLFSNSELQTIALKSKESEYRIQRRTASKDDFLRYIQYELDLLKITEMRRKDRGLSSNMSGTECLIINRINNIFNLAGLRFPDDLNLSMTHFKFCEKMGLNARQVVGRILQVHGSKSPDYWKFAAQYEMEKMDSLENARQHILKGLKFHPESSVLYEQAFLLELMYASKLADQSIKTEENADTETMPDRLYTGLSSSTDVSGPLLSKGPPGDIAQLGSNNTKEEWMNGKLALIMYELGVSKLKDVRFLIKCLSIAKEFSLTMNIQEKIVNDLVSNYHNEELTWDTMARRELEGLSYSPVDPGPSCSGSTMSDMLSDDDSDCPSSPSKHILEAVEREKIKKKTKVSLKERIRRCCDVYDAGVRKLDTHRMWALYIECLLELLGNGTEGLERYGIGGEGGNPSLATLQPNPYPRYTRKMVLRAFRGAHNAHKMTEKYYLLWVEILQGENTSNATVTTLSTRMKKGMNGNKEKSPLCLGTVSKGELKRKRDTKLVKKVAHILAEATDHLPHSAELWMTRLRHHICHSSTIRGNKRQEHKKAPGNVSAASSSDQSTISSTRIISVPEVVFSKACSQLGGTQEAVPIWKVMLLYTQAKGDTACIESLFIDAIKKEPPISLVFKPLYIEWLVLSQGIIAARKVYDQINSVPPLCLELHRKMAYLEGMQPNVNMKHAKKCYELACEQFGRSSTDVWLEYVKFEISRGTRENANNLYVRAINSLENLQANIFMTEYFKLVNKDVL